MATKPKGVKAIAVEEVKVKTSSVDNAETHDSKKPVLKTVKERKSPERYISHHNSGETSNKVVVKKDGLYAYINRKHADSLVANGQGYAYGKKSEWKKLVRDAKEPKLLTVPPFKK